MDESKPLKPIFKIFLVDFYDQGFFLVHAVLVGDY